MTSGNVAGDHLVGWANASLRHTWELPEIAPRGTGVVRADPLDAAYWPGQRPAAPNQVELACIGTQGG